MVSTLVYNLSWSYVFLLCVFVYASERGEGTTPPGAAGVGRAAPSADHEESRDSTGGGS